MDEEMILGSGSLYTVEYTDTIPDDATFEASANLLGLISGGASIEYKPKFYTAKDDLGLVSKTIITEEEATLKSGICTFNGKTLDKLCSTARVTEEGGKRTVKVGGLKNNNGKQYAIRFVHVDGDVRVTIVGQNQSGFTLKFDKGKETVIDAEFVALPCDNEGTLIIYEESTAAEVLKTLAITSVAGTTSGTTKVTVTPSLVSGHMYVYKTASSVTAPILNDILTGWTVWDGISDITATTGNKIAISEVDGILKCKSTGQTTVTSKA